jgi:hypothetical protein
MRKTIQEQARIPIEVRMLEQLEGTQAGHAVRVTVIEGGTSRNGYYYNEAALLALAALVEGAHAYADHGNDTTSRSVRDVVGFYHDAQYIDGEGTPRVDATLHIFEAADWLWSLIREAFQLGRPELIGLSIDIFAHWQLDAQRKVKEITQVIALNSCDIVTRPSAGGALKHILHAHHDERMTASSSEVVQEESEMLQPIADKQPYSTDVEQKRLQAERFLAEARLERSALTLERRLQESQLPVAVKEQVRARFVGRAFEESELEGELQRSRDLLAQLTRDGTIQGHGYEKAVVSGVVSETEKIQAAFDAMFDLEIDSARMGNIRPFYSLREAYARVTGDASVTGSFSDPDTPGRVGLGEHLPMYRVGEADTTTASFSYLLGSSMNKRLLKDYMAWPAEWMKFASVVPIKDFKQQSRVRMGAFGSLPIVAEDTAYAGVVAQDSAATYVPQKRGNLVTVSRETILNDDLQAIRQIPTKLATAAAYTLAEFVYGFLSSNPVIYDGSALFTSGAPHNNLGASALSTAAMQSGVTAMREQTNFAGKRIGLRPRYLIVPPELEWTALVATKSANVPGSPNNDINPMLGYVTPIVAPQLASATQWFMASDPREVETLEIGFVGGQTNPALFIQDSPLLGLNFTQDVITYKVRHEYGGAVVDFRGLYRGV